MKKNAHVDATSMLSRTIAGLEIDRMPDDIRTWLLSGFRAFRSGAGPLDTCLNLRPQPGKRSLATQATLHWRDAKIRAMAAVMDGTMWDKAAWMARFFEGDDPFGPTGLAAEISLELIASGVPLPASQIQFWRILDGDRSR